MRAVRRGHGLNAEALLLAPWWMSRVETLCDEVDALRSREVPDGHVRIDGKVYRLEPDFTRSAAALVPVEEP